MSEDHNQQTTEIIVVPLASSSGGRVSGKNWKDAKSSTRRSHMPQGVKAKSFADRMHLTVKERSVKKLVQEMKDEKQVAEAARKQKIVDRRKAKAEKERLEALRAKMSARRVERLKKRQGRSKKINQ